eukprot:2642934-Prymnesium_polylepis.1
MSPAGGHAVCCDARGDEPQRSGGGGHVPMPRAACWRGAGLLNFNLHERGIPQQPHRSQPSPRT